MPTYSSSVKYYRINNTNRAIAASNKGTGNPIEEITAPVLGGTFATIASTTVTCTTAGGNNFSNFSPGQYLYYIDNNNGNYVLVGQIATIASGGLSLTLTANALTTPQSGSTLVASFFLVSTVESFYIRVATEIGGTAGADRVNLPKIADWRENASLTSNNRRAVTKLERVTNVGVPLSTASSIQNIPFQITTQNVFTQSGASGSFWNTLEDFPAFIWLRADINTGEVANSLAGKTGYRFTTLETLESLNVGINTPQSTLVDGGYNISGVSSGGPGSQE